MKQFIWLLIIGGVLLGVFRLWEFYDQQQQTKDLKEKEIRQITDGSNLQGMSQALEGTYRTAQSKGVLGLRDFLRDYKGTEHLLDPRMGHIELDYAVLMMSKDPAVARRVFTEVKDRTPPHSPLQQRLKLMERTFN
ncbi:MAG: hypothetical protein FJ405_04750 [Verrucomicrobia bacterium]|nr:hypothetical protein [Verrucomicrobiota bacterium]